MSLDSALSSAGLLLNGAIIADESIQRCGTARRPRSKNGWYIAYADGSAIYGNWEDGDGYSVYKPDGLTKPQALDRSRIDKLKAEREAERERIAIEAAELIESLPTAGNNEYMQRKGIASLPPRARFDLNSSAIILPLQDSAGKVWSVQRIYPDGAKYFLSGGRTQGCYFPIAGTGSPTIVCEGFATGYSINQATNLPVIVALNAGNLKTVADSLPAQNIVIAADNDASRVGEEAARSTGYPYVMPPVVGWDFNDLALERGLDAVSSYFIKPTTVSDSPSSPLQAHGIVGEIADWITATSIRPQPILSLAAALSFVAMLKGHHVKGYTDLRTNLLCLSLAPTSAGKEHPQNCLRRLSMLTGLDKHMMAEPVSGAGFLNGINKASRVGLLVMDEIGRYVGNLSNKNAGSWQREILDYMIKSFSSANSMLMGRQYADDKKNPTINIFQPHFCCLGSSVIERFQEACGSSEVIDGFLNRWILFSTNERPARQEKVKFSPPSEQLIERIKALASLRTYTPYGEPELREVRFTPEAWDYFTSYRHDMDKLIASSPYPLDCLYARSAEHVEKIALTLSDSEDVLIKDVALAIRIVAESNKAIRSLALNLADTNTEQEFNKVADIIKKRGIMSRWQLSRSTQFVQGGERRRMEILETLKGNNMIAEIQGANGKLLFKWIGE